MSKIKKIQLAELLKVSRAAITKAVNSGLLVADSGLIDLENPVNKYYIAAKGIILSEFEDNNMPKKSASYFTSMVGAGCSCRLFCCSRNFCCHSSTVNVCGGREL